MNSRLGSLASLSAIAIILVLGVGYLVFGVAKVTPQTRPTATMTLADSGGLRPHSKVLLSGIEVGRVTDVRHVGTGVTVTFQYEDRYRVPATGPVRIQSLSGFGEPYLEFVPTTPGGPYLHDGQSVAADQVSLPVSIPEVAQQVTTVLGQVDPDAINSIVGTFSTGFHGTEAVIPRIARSTDLLAATLLSRTDIIRKMLLDLQRNADDMAWAGPDLLAAAQPWGDFGPRVSAMVTALAPLARTGDVPADYLVDTPDSIGLIPLLDRLAEWSKQQGPDLAKLFPVMQPLVTSAQSALQHLDISSLIEQALTATSSDGALPLRVTVK
jgi:virulence factor Mce-like protein